VLDLTNTGIMDKGATILLNDIVGIQILKYLYLSSNGLTSETCKILANMLHTTNLEQIGLGCNRLGDSGSGWLANALANPLCKLKSLEIASCGIGSNGAKLIADSLQTNTSLMSLNMGFLKSTNDLGEVPNVIGSVGAVHIANTLSTNTTLRLLDLVYTGIQQAGITALSEVLSTKNMTLIYLNIEQFGIPHNELSREIIRKSIQRNKESIPTELLTQIDMVICPPHLEEIQSVYRVI
jgi:Ran GTPase-activating protein (RanGAP) involved in mRNA processing and transport